MTATACFTFDHLDDLTPFFDLLERHAVRGTFFVEGRHGDESPEQVAEIVRRGHELGMHGWAHEEWSTLDPQTEDDLASRATDALERAAGVRPRAFRAPAGERSAHTVEMLQTLGYHYDASLGDGMRVTTLTPGIAQVPFVWPGVDGYWYLREEPASPDEVRESWLAELDKAASTDHGLFLTICHAFLTGAEPGRIAALDAVMAAAVADRRVRVAAAGEVASYATTTSR